MSRMHSRHKEQGCTQQSKQWIQDPGVQELQKVLHPVLKAMRSLAKVEQREENQAILTLRNQEQWVL